MNLPNLTRLALVSLAALLGLLPWVQTARACATCAVGDPTLTTFGLGQPFAQRLRVGMRYQLRHSELDGGTPDAFQLQQHEAALIAAYTPNTWLTLDGDVPVVHREVDRASGAVSRTTQLGDATFGGRMRLWAKARVGRSQNLWSVLRLRLPTGPRLSDPNGGLLPLEQQTGSGAFVPQLGLGYAHTGGLFSTFLSARAELPSQGFAHSRPSRGVFATVAAQWQPRPWFGLRVSWEQAYQGAARELDGSTDPDSGGLLWGAAMSVLLAPLEDLVIQIGGQLPVWQHLRGQHAEGPSLLASLLYDLGDD